KKFDFGTLGMFASLGKRSAVADILGIRISGFIAWLAWRSYYLSQLPGFVRKVRVFLDWNLDLVFPRDIAQIQSLKADRLRIDHYEPGEIVIRKHEIGRELFIVKNGEVEVFQPPENGGAELMVATLKRGEV